ncbi:SAGA complex subunit spt3 [Nilaparvata lugens]|uniref:SAGA complex subunit spt3 n=1 Tax=Nilaparvata lugens TaxID=108931 RepID=UPI00193D3AD0|nr:SAGA complex subunit spt3 [Nilaparvata lugens]
MLFGLGDCSKPLLTTAKMIETLLLQQMAVLLDQVEEIAMRRDSSKIEMQDIVFVMRKDKAKLTRLLNIIDFKDSKSWRNSESETVGEDGHIKAKPLKRKDNCLQFLKAIGVTGVCDTSADDDYTLKERRVRSDIISENLSYSNGEYGDFVASRSLSFFRKDIKPKLWDALKRVAPGPMSKLKANTEDFISFLAKETIAIVIDYALLVRQDKSMTPGDLFSRARVLYKVNRLPITPEEIKEVIRRFFSNQLSPFGTITRSTTSYLDKKLMVC